MNKLILAFLIAAFLLVLPVQATIYVGGEDGVATISEAITLAKENDTIIVYEGIYRENVVIDKPLILKASGNVTIEAADDSASVVWIKANNVVFSSFNVKGGYVGIRLINVQSCKIGNNSVLENDFGIGMISSCNNSIANNTAFNNKVNGINLQDHSNNNRIKNNIALNNYGGNQCGGIRINSSNNNTINNNNASNNSANGIYLISSNNNIIGNNFALNNSYGFYLENSSNCLIEYNTASENEYGISLDSCNDNSIVNNVAFKNGQNGIHLQDHSNNNRIENNIALNNNGGGIRIGLSNNNTVNNNNVSSNYYNGIVLRYSINNTIGNNVLNNSYNGIYLSSSINNRIENNLASHNTYGIWLQNSSNNIIGNNNASKNQGGIMLASSSNNSIVDNVAIENEVSGIHLQVYSNNNKIGGSTVRNGNSGLYIQDSFGNVICNNIFDNNLDGIFLISANKNELRNNSACENIHVGLQIEDSEENIVTHNSLSMNLYGIALRGANKNELWNNTASENSDGGLKIVDSEENVVTHNSLSRNLDGIILISANKNELRYNSACENSNEGLQIQNSEENIVTHNSLSRNLHGIALILGANKNELRNNTASENSAGGLTIDDSEENIVTHNSLSMNLYGIALRGANKNELWNNTASENSDGGLKIVDSEENVVTHNSLSRNSYGIALISANKNELRYNSACENSKGLSIEYSEENVVTHNSLSRNLYGIVLLRANKNELRNNTASENSDNGLKIQDSEENVVTHNSLSRNLYGIVLLRANKNELRNNNVEDSKDDQAKIQNSTHNTFDYNYWSDYTGEDVDNNGLGDDPYALEGYGQEDDYDNHPYMNYSGWLNVVIRPEHWEFYSKKGDIQYFYNNFSIENRLHSPTTVEVILEHNLEFVADSDSGRTSTKTVSIDPKSSKNVTLRLNVTNLEGYILRTITFKTEEYMKTTLVHGLVQPKINEVKIEGVDYHRNVVLGQINPFNVILRNHGDRDEFNVTLTMGSKKQSKCVFLSDNKSETKTVPFEIDTSDMQLGITRGQVVVLKSNKLSDHPLDYLNLTMFVASEHEASTLIVTNLSRFTDSEDLRKKLIRLTHHPAVNGILLDVSCNYSEFDFNYKANQLCEAIKNQIEAVITEYPNLKYLIIAGDDNIIPFYRVWDGTRAVFTRETGLPDESKYYYSDHYPNPLSESIDDALSSNHFLTDDFYTRLEGDRVLAVGRLVEKPDEIIRAIDMFFNYYQLTPKSIFVTSCETIGYEFMYDGGEECYHEWRKRIEIATDKSKRINTTFKYRYKKGSNYGQPHEIIDGISNSSVSAIFLHANYDQFEVPPGEGGGERGYLKAGELKVLNGSLIYSIGCHAGLTIPNVNDLPQSFLSHGTIAYIAPTGYGLGGVITVAGHERLLKYLTKRIARGEDVGFALLNAKNDYYLDNFHMDTVDDKVLRSLTLYGFPMYTVRLDSHSSAKSESACATPLLGHAAQKRSIAALGGDTFEVHAKEDKAYNASNITLEKITITLEPTCNVVKTANGTYYTYEGYTTEAGMPILPKATLYFIRGEKEIRGMVLRSAKFDVKDTTLVVETFAVSGTVGRSYNFTGWYPTIPFTLNSIEDRQSIVTASAQYKLIRRVSINAWQGTIRLFNETVLEIFRVPESADRKKPIVSVAIDTGTVTVKAEDNAGIYDAFVTYLGPRNRTWASKTMDKQDRGKLSVEYRIQLNNTAFFVQVVDVDGNVKIDDNKGEYYVC